MRRRLMYFSALLPVGVFLTIASTWLLSSGKISFDGKDSERGPTDADIAMWRSYEFAGAADAPSHVGEYRSTGARLLRMHDLGVFAATTKAGHMLERTDAGWPMFAMHGAVFHDLAWVGTKRIDWHGLFVDFDNRYGIGVINCPLRPHWGGFIINTLFYTLWTWLFVLAIGKLRRTIRLWRGLCPMCKYPIGSSTVCTECGAALRGRNISSCAVVRR